MKNFIKLKNKFIINEYSIQQLRVWYGKKDNNKFKGIWYSDVECQDKDTIFGSIPTQFRPYFTMKIMEVNTRIPPHTDSRILSTINFYIKTDNCLTQFYKFKSENPTTRQIENQTNGYLFNVEDLETADSFIAESNDAYLLDVSKPHSVIPLEITNIHRSAIVLQTNRFAFDEVLEMLKETNNT
jgi:hypothetical protein